METDPIKHAYKEHLIEAGVHRHRADQVCENLTPLELEIITEIWSTWANTWERLNQKPSEAIS